MTPLTGDVPAQNLAKPGTQALWLLCFYEACLLGAFMVSASVFTALIFHPQSPLNGVITNPLLQRTLVGIAMGLTAVVLIYSPMGKQSGALMNPAMTIAFLRLGRIPRRTAAFYIVAQFIGAIAGMALMALMIHRWVVDPSVNYVTTLPGDAGIAAAFVAEFGITFLLVTVVITVNKSPRLARFTGWFAGFLISVYIAFEAPISGMSMNPARTVGSAVFANVWTGWWIYFTAPVLGMLLAGEVQLRLTHRPDKLCGKLSHSHRDSCIFKCDCLRHQQTEVESCHQTTTT